MLVALRQRAGWTPTYIGSQPEGIWCNAHYCVVVENSKWSNQGKFSGGLILRF
jgi:hypothetical protein